MPPRRNYRQKTHVRDGFPHYSTAFPHHCICLAECCQDDRPEVGNGCICKTCSCQFGFGHGQYVKEETDELEAQIREKQSR